MSAGNKQPLSDEEVQQALGLLREVMKDARPAVQPFSDDELLLIAAGKVQGIGIEAVGIEADLAGHGRRLGTPRRG